MASVHGLALPSCGPRCQVESVVADGRAASGGPHHHWCPALAAKTRSRSISTRRMELATGRLRALIQVHHLQTAHLLVGRHPRGHEGLQLRFAHERPQAPRTPWALPRLLVRTRNDCRVGHRPRRWNMGRPKGIVDVQWVCPIMGTRDIPQSFDKFIGTENYL